MKKITKTCLSLLLLLTLITTINPIVPIPQPEDNEPGITTQGDNDNDNADDHIGCF